MSTATDVARKVRALLAKAESTAFEAEAEAFNAQAMRLMAEHKIDEVLLAEGDRDRDEIIEKRDAVDLGAGPYVVAYSSLIGGVMEALGVEGFYYTYDRRRVMTLYGYRSDVERVELLYTSLLAQATRFASQAEVPFGASTIRVRRSFLFGFARRVGERLAEAMKSAAEEAEESTSVALVLVDRAAQVEQSFAEAHPRLGKPAKASPVDGAAYRQGEAAGNRASLGHTGVASATVAALS